MLTATYRMTLLDPIFRRTLIVVGEAITEAARQLTPAPLIPEDLQYIHRRYAEQTRTLVAFLPGPARGNDDGVCAHRFLPHPGVCSTGSAR